VEAGKNVAWGFAVKRPLMGSRSSHGRDNNLHSDLLKLLCTCRVSAMLETRPSFSLPKCRKRLRIEYAKLGDDPIKVRDVPHKSGGFVLYETNLFSMPRPILPGSSC
jgi:hypothetical protein